MSEAVPVHASRVLDDSPEVTVPSALLTAPPMPIAADGQLVPKDTEVSQLKSSEVEMASSAADTVSSTLTAMSNSNGNQIDKGDGKGTANGRPKAEITTLEQFIVSAYGRKGQRVKLSPKAARLVAQNLLLDDAAMNKLLALADADAQLTVARQLLLLSREVEGLSSLRTAISSFVSTVMLRHPVFADPGVRAALRNLPDAPQVEHALKRLGGFVPQSANGKDGLKPAELKELRQNAVNLMAAWLATSRGLNLDELSKLLFQVVWAPAARELVDENARLRALTEIEQVAGVGVACDKFRENVTQAGVALDQAQREASVLRVTNAELSARLGEVEAERDALVTELVSLKESSAGELAEVRKQHEVERTHLQHDQEQLRGRLVRCMSESIEMLEVGLTALRNKTPRTEVMAERAEHVIDALRAEEKKLRED